MYKLLIPIKAKQRSREEFEALAGELRRAGIDEILLIYNRVLYDETKKDEYHSMYLESMADFVRAGFRMGAWFAPTIGYGAPNGMEYGAEEAYTHLTTVQGEEIKGCFCPTDDRFVEEFCDIIKRIASTGVERILFEDDFTFTGGKRPLPNMSCYCENHRKLFAERIGREMSGEELFGYLFEGPKNRYRDAFIKMHGDTLREFVRKIERAVHSEYPEVRLGLSANASSFEFEGTDIAELTRLIAGNTRPFLRMTGAPYWDNAMMLGANIEAVRLQQHFCDNGSGDIELITEGDTYPRPRHWIPSAYLEIFDMTLRADGGSEGILKYMVDYNSKARYETGYIDRHVLNAPHYAEIEKRFAGMEPVGLNVFHQMGQFADKTFDELSPWQDWAPDTWNVLPTLAQWFITDNSIPTTYGRTDCASIVFGDSALYADDEMLKNGVILDAQAARVMLRRGIDIGVESYCPAETPFAEYFIGEDEFTTARAPARARYLEFTLKPGAEVLSRFIVSNGALGVINPVTIRNGKQYPACYFYENSDGQRFMVYAFFAHTVATKTHWRPGVFRSYCRQHQLMEGIAKLQKRPLPAVCPGNPELYILAKKGKDRMSVGLWNIFADSVLSPEITLDEAYDSVDFYNCTGRIEGNRVLLDESIPPYGFALFTVKRGE